MAIAPFLAMTAAEFYAATSLPPRIAWMACHFSPYGLGLSNLPKDLPPGSLLMVDDITPPHGHDPEWIAQQLTACVETFGCSGILLDFQRSGCEETHCIAKHLSKALPCPVAVTEPYADDSDCSVFLSALPPSVTLEEQLPHWPNREIWLELGTDGEIITLTEHGAECCPLPSPDPMAAGFQEEALCCHYSVRTDEKAARFTLWRTNNDMVTLLEKAETLGIVKAIGLYQELKDWSGENRNRLA